MYHQYSFTSALHTYDPMALDGTMTYLPEDTTKIYRVTVNEPLEVVKVYWTSGAVWTFSNFSFDDQDALFTPPSMNALYFMLSCFKRIYKNNRDDLRIHGKTETLFLSSYKIKKAVYKPYFLTMTLFMEDGEQQIFSAITQKEWDNIKIYSHSGKSIVRLLPTLRRKHSVEIDRRLVPPLLRKPSDHLSIRRR